MTLTQTREARVAELPKCGDRDPGEALPRNRPDWPDRKGGPNPLDIYRTNGTRFGRSTSSECPRAGAIQLVAASGEYLIMPDPGRGPLMPLCQCAITPFHHPTIVPSTLIRLDS